MEKKIHVLVVDDSAVARQAVSALLQKDPAIHVLAAVADPILAMSRMKIQWPDVIVLDIEMPRMDGISFLKMLMQERPTPVVICATLTAKGADTSMHALAAGAIAVVAKPTTGMKDFLGDASAELIHAVKAAARANVRNLKSLNDAKPQPKLSADAILQTPGTVVNMAPERIVAIGTSTGGTQALELILIALPRACPGLVIVQHMPEKFTASLAERLNGLCGIRVREACDGDRVAPGLALIAPGGRHMLLKRSGMHYFVEVVGGPPVGRHCPSVDVLFRSVAKYAGKNAMGIIMTGMGGDGASGLLEMKKCGAYTLAQNEETCVVYGMPKEALRLGATEKTIGLPDIAGEIIRFL